MPDETGSWQVAESLQGRVEVLRRDGETVAVDGGEVGRVLPEVLLFEAVEEDGVRFGVHESERDGRRFASGDVREREDAVRGLAVEPVEVVARQPRDGGDGVDDGVAADASSVALDEFGGVDGVPHPVEFDRRRVLAEVEDDVAIESGGEDAGELSDVLAAPPFVDVEEGGHEPGDEADPGALPTTALVVGDDAGGDAEFVRQFGLRDVEIRPPLPQGRTRVLTEGDLSRDPFRETCAGVRLHTRCLPRHAKNVPVEHDDCRPRSLWPVEPNGETPKPSRYPETPMPSTLVHVAFGGFIAAGLLGTYFDRRSVLVVLAAAALPDLDSFLAIWLVGTHRALLHNLVLPGLAAGALYVDTRRPVSRIRDRFGDRGIRVAWVSVVAFVFAGVAPDLVTNGANPLYPLLDRYVTVDGKLLVSSTRGVVQTFVELHPEGSTVGGTTEDTFYYTGVDTDPGPDETQAERIFPLVSSGMQALVVILSGFVLAARFWDESNRRT